MTPSLIYPYKGTIKTISFYGPVTKRTVKANIYLPPDYKNSGRSYPVLYHLYGLGGKITTNNNSLANALEKSVGEGIVDNMICVFPDGYQNSFWADSWDMKKPAATNIIQELIPYVDSTYRTIGTREARAIEGFSMGGYGAAMLCAKYYTCFCAAVIFDGAMLTWEGLPGSKAPEARKEIFHNDRAYHAEWDPWTLPKKNAVELKNRGVPFRINEGRITANKNYYNFLHELGISSFFFKTGCSHNFDCVMNETRKENFTFLAQHMDQRGSTKVRDNANLKPPTPAFKRTDHRSYDVHGRIVDSRAVRTPHGTVCYLDRSGARILPPSTHKIEKLPGFKRR